MIKFPSLQSLIKAVINTLLRFPLPLLFSFVGTAVAIYMTRLGYEQKDLTESLAKIVMVCSLGLPLLFSVKVYVENNTFSKLYISVVNAVAVGLIVLYYFTLPGKMEIVEFTRFFVLNIGVHLLVAYAPFVGKEQVNGFWQFNKSLFLRILTSGLYSGVLYIGLILAMLAVDNLLGVHIKDQWYLRLWIFMAGIFNTWFFLAGIPANIGELENNHEYPKGLKIFTQFVLLPLVTLYLVILYIYTIKILVLWSLPKGWVSYLVLGFSILGILSLLLIYPVREKEGNAWIKVFSRWFYRALFPLIILLVVAIGKRVLEYGITENRYFILILAMWLTATAIYFLASRNKNIKLIPITLSVLALLSSFGPLSAFSVSLRSQVKQLERLLTETNILVNGKVQKNTGKLDKEKAMQITSIVRYLDKTHGYEKLQPWFDKNMSDLFKEKDKDIYVYKPGVILDAFGVKETNEYDEEGREYFYAYTNEQRALDIRGYDYIMRMNGSYGDSLETAQGYDLGSDSLVLNYSPAADRFILKKNDKVCLEFSLQEFLNTARHAEPSQNTTSTLLSPEKMTFVAQNDSVQAKLFFRNFSCNIKGDKLQFNYADGDMLLKFK